MSDTKIENTEVLICPYCGFEDKFAEYELDRDEWTTYGCGNCGKTFSAIKHIKILFTSDIYE